MRIDRFVRTPNQATRREDIRYVILHCTEMEDDEAAIRDWCDPKLEISPHYFIQKDGTLIQLVKDDKVAWHAGVSSWHEGVSLNKNSIGVELSNLGEGSGDPYTPAQYKTLVLLLRDLQRLYHILPEHVLAHSDIAPERKTDPGQHFDWSILEGAGVAKRGK